MAPRQSANSVAKITVQLTNTGADQIDDAELESMRSAIPAARGLPLLQAIAMQKQTQVILDYLDSTRLAVDISPC